MREELLEKIRELVKCSFISDIKYCISKENLLHFYKEEKTLAGYAIGDWADVCDYFFEEGNQELEFSSEKELIDYLEEA